MSNLGMIIAERSRDIGDFLVGRLLPFRKKRMVGPFAFFDHMGPHELQPGQRMDIEPHPHLGLSTLTYLIEGEIVHRDSLGTEQTIRPGAVNWMTAGKGIVHSERSPREGEDSLRHIHGLQIWVALPLEHEDTEPSFTHIEADELPAWQEGDLHLKLLAGKAYERKSPVPVYSDLFMLELKAGNDTAFSLDESLRGEVGLYVLGGALEACDEVIEAGHLLVAKDDGPCQFKLRKGAHVIVFGGAPFPEGRQIFWNFVASSRERLEAAAERWRQKEFPAIPHDEGYVPLPGE